MIIKAFIEAASTAGILSLFLIGGTSFLTGCESDPAGNESDPPSSPRGPFSIDIEFSDEVDDLDQADAFKEAINLAAERWAELIAGDLPDVTLSAQDDDCPDCPDCGVQAPAVIDDLAIRVEVSAEDGPGGILAGASPVCLRQEGLPVTGLIRFDSDDLSLLVQRNILETIVLHEMGHVLGFGTLWRVVDPRLIAEESCTYADNGVTESCDASGRFDTRYIGSAGSSAWRELGGTGSVPLENALGVGSSDTHWRESSPLRNELMSPQVSGRSPLSLLTLRSLEDIGYIVADDSLADSFDIDLAGASIIGESNSVRIPHDILHQPMIYISTDGTKISTLPETQIHDHHH